MERCSTCEYNGDCLKQHPRLGEISWTQTYFCDDYVKKPTEKVKKNE